MAQQNFIIAEDDALKDLLKGMTVKDQNDNARKVGVWFSLPEPEERQRAYPFVSISLIDISEERDRAHRGIITYPFTPAGYDEPDDGSNLRGETPIPVSLVYQVTTFARSAWHDRQITSQMLGGRIPLRFGTLHVAADETIRRLDTLEWQSLDGIDGDRKRVFRKAYTIAVSSELFPEAIEAVRRTTHVVTSVNAQLVPFDPDAPLGP